MLTELKSRLSFINPKWEENEKRGYWNGETPRVLKFYEVADDGEMRIGKHLTIGIVSSVYKVAEKVSKSIFLNPF